MEVMIEVQSGTLLRALRFFWVGSVIRVANDGSGGSNPLQIGWITLSNQCPVRFKPSSSSKNRKQHDDKPCSTESSELFRNQHLIVRSLHCIR